MLDYIYNDNLLIFHQAAMEKQHVGTPEAYYLLGALVMKLQVLLDWLPGMHT